MGRRNIKTQLKHVICQSNRIGYKKRTDKKNGVNTKQYIYSYNGMKKAFQFSNNFADWLKVNYPEIKMVRDIGKEHLQQFLDSKQDVTSKTMKEYRSRGIKLGVMMSNVFNLNKDFTGLEINGSHNKHQSRPPMQREDYNKLSNTLLGKKTSARFLPEIASRIGCRSNEGRHITVNDIDLVNKRVHLRITKNGNPRYVPIREKDIPFFSELKSYMESNGWTNAVNGIQENSFNRAIRGAMKECGISDKYYQSIHAIRKMYAVERMKEEREKGYNFRDAWSTVQRELGHGYKFRQELYNAYCSNEV